MTRPLYETLSNFDRWLITVVIMAATLMELIDSTIVNVALPHMQGSLGASGDEITWVLTSYIIATAICMPLTGYFADRFGRKNYLIFSMIAFTLSSVLCGTAQSLTEMVCFRLLQGLFGAGLIPLSQAILADIFPPEERGKAMAIWGIGIMVGPVLGPTLGGYLIDLSNWRWIFYINLPVGLFTVLLSHIIPDSVKKERKMDWIGLVLIITAISGLQYILDRGNQEDWFESRTICFITYMTITAFLGFILHGLNRSGTSVFNLKIFLDRNFCIATLLLAIFCLGFYGMIVTQPMMMEGLLHYPALITGMMMAPRGISGMMSMMIVGKLINRVDPRVLIGMGTFISISTIEMTTHYSLDIDSMGLILPMFLQGFGMGLVFVPLSTLAYSTLPVHLRTEAAGIYNLLRTIGGSIGISIATTLLTRDSQFFWQHLGGFIQPYNTLVYQYLHPLHLHPAQLLGKTVLSTELYRQASMLAFLQVFKVIMWCFILMVPLIFLLRNPKKLSAPKTELAEG